MADRIEIFAVLVPAGTLQTAPQTSPLAFTDGIVQELEIVVPDGHAGMTGFQLAYGGQTIIPESGNVFVVTNDEVIHWPLENYPTGKQWQLVAFNQDLYDHHFYLRFLIKEIPPPGESVVSEPIVITPPGA